MTDVLDTEGAKTTVADMYREVLYQATENMLSDMRDNAPRDTGAMLNNITNEASDSDTVLSRTLHALEEYSSYQDEGTGFIYPVSAKVLHFFAKDGTEVFAAFTTGVPATHWWSGVVDNAGDYLQAAMP